MERRSNHYRSRGRAIFVAALLLPTLLGAQATQGTAISGVVSDGDSTPIVAARVRIVELSRETTTSARGEFAFAAVPPGSYTLRVQRIGYHPLSREVVVGDQAVTGMRFVLEPAPVALPTTIVTGTVGERSASEVISPTTVVDAAQLARKLSATIAATLSREPGVSVAGMGPATARPVIRGLGGDRVVILEDGARPGDLAATSPDHAVAIDPLTTSRFEVVRGPMSLLYGSSALGGVVNVIREEVPSALVERPDFTVSVEANSMNRGMAAGGSFTAALGDLAVRAEGSARNAGNLRTPVGQLDNTELTTLGAALGASLVGENGHVGGSYRYYRNEYGLPGGFIGAHEEGVDIFMRRSTARLEASRDLSGGSGLLRDLEGNVSLTDYYHAEIHADGDVATSFDQSFAGLDLIARHGQHSLFTDGAFGLRGQFREIHTAGALKTPSTRDYTVAAFIVEEWEQGVLHLQAGLRYDWSRYEPLEPATVEVNDVEIPALPRTFGAVSGALGSLIHASDAMQFGVNLSRAYRTPDFNELYSDGPHLAAFSYDVGNPRIGEETGMGLDVFARVARSGLRAEIAWFRNQMNDFIFPVNTGTLGATGVPKFQYVGKDAVLTGAEGSLEWNALPRLVLEANASYVRGALSDKPDSIPAIGDEPARPGSIYLPLMPPLNGHAGLRYETSAWTFGVETRFAARQERIGNFETETAGYAVMNASLEWRVFTGRRLHSITLRAENLLDREYRDHLSRVKSIMPQAGRAFSILYRLTN